MHTLVDMIYSHKAQTVAGLAVQARAFSLDWIERWGDGTSEDQGTRQFDDLVCAFAGVTPVALEGKTVKSFTQRPAKADPIFAAIERYKKAYERHGDTCHAVSQYEEAHREADGALPTIKIIPN